MTDTGLELGPKALGSSVKEFVVENDAYYSAAFEKIQGTNGFRLDLEQHGGHLSDRSGGRRAGPGGSSGPSWCWNFLPLCRSGAALWGELGADQMAKYEKLLANIARREQQAKEALAAGDQAAADTATKVASNLQRVADKAKEQADLAANEATTILLVGIGLLILFKIVEGFYANISYRKTVPEMARQPLGAGRGSAAPAPFSGSFCRSPFGR